MVFKDGDLPPVFTLDAPKYDTLADGVQVTHKLTKSKLRSLLEAKGYNGEGKVADLQKQAKDADIPLTETNGKIIEGYIGKPKGAAQISCERGFLNLEGKLPNGTKCSMNGTSSKDRLTGVTNVDKTTSVVRTLSKCHDI